HAALAPESTYRKAAQLSEATPPISSVSQQPPEQLAPNSDWATPFHSPTGVQATLTRQRPGNRQPEMQAYASAAHFRRELRVQCDHFPSETIAGQSGFGPQ